MPMYEYRCTKCGEVVDVLFRMGEAPQEITGPPLHHPPCQQDGECKLKRILSSFGGSFGDTPRHH